MLSSNKEPKKVRTNSEKSATKYAAFAALGSEITPILFFGFFSQAAGIALTYTFVAATGGAILVIPHYFLAQKIANNFEHKPNLHFCLQATLAITTAVCSGLIGTAILGMSVNPFGLCIMSMSIASFLLIQFLIPFITHSVKANSGENRMKDPISLKLDENIYPEVFDLNFKTYDEYLAETELKKQSTDPVSTLSPC